MAGKTKSNYSKLAWGITFLLIAALILSNYFGGFVELGVWSMIIAALALVILIHCIASLSISPLPLPLAALYYIFQVPLGLPQIQFWPLALVTVLVMCGLFILLPHSFRKKGQFVFAVGDSMRGCDNVGGRGGRDGSGAEIEDGVDDDNPHINVRFGSLSRYLHSDCLESAELLCSFGAIEAYFDHVTLSPNGANVYVNCSFGAIEIFVPGNWRVINEISASLGNAEVDRRLESAPVDSPTLTITGSVSLGSIEVRRV